MLTFGSLQLDSHLFLSPLAGYTNLGFRLLVRHIGGMAMTTTDLVHARALLHNSPKSLELIQTCLEEKILRVQIFGSDPQELAEAARRLEGYGVAALDINMGCPVQKVVRCGAGSALLSDRETATSLVKKVVEAVKIPVTVKMRLGWDENNLTAHLLAPYLEDVGVAAITIHGRTRAQGFSGKVNLEGIRRVVEAVKYIPVIGNGDITKPQHARQMLEQTGCAGLMIGRGALANPWIFRDIQAYLTGHEIPSPPSAEEKVAAMNFHFHKMIEQFGERSACLKFRKMGIWYAKSMPNGKIFHSRIEKVSSALEYQQIVEEYLQPFLDAREQDFPNWGEEPQVPVPAGPNSMW